MNEFLICLTHTPHLKAMLMCAVLFGASLGGMATMAVLVVRGR